MKGNNAPIREVRKFGMTFSVLLLALASFLYYKENELWMLFLVGSGFFLLISLFVYGILKPIYVGWMTFAYALGWLNSRIILGLVFYLIFTPIGLLLRVLRKDLLGLRFDKRAVTYWVKRSPSVFDKKRYEQLF